MTGCGVVFLFGAIGVIMMNKIMITLYQVVQTIMMSYVFYIAESPEHMKNDVPAKIQNAQLAAAYVGGYCIFDID